MYLCTYTPPQAQRLRATALALGKDRPAVPNTNTEKKMQEILFLRQKYKILSETPSLSHTRKTSPFAHTRRGAPVCG